MVDALGIRSVVVDAGRSTTSTTARWIRGLPVIAATIRWQMCSAMFSAGQVTSLPGSVVVMVSGRTNSA